MEKNPYIKPAINKVEIDTHISVVLMSAPDNGTTGDPIAPPAAPPMG